MRKALSGLLCSLTALLVFAGCSHTEGVLPPSGKLSASIDAESTACVKCHKARHDHPVGTDYAESIRLKKTGLVPVSSLNASVRLIDGRIGCATCHVRYSGHDHKTLASKRADGGIPDPMLVMDNTKSGLCLACHRK